MYAAASYFNARRLVRGPAYPCSVVFGVVAPMYKPLAFPMWSALMPIASFAYWLRHRHIEPRHVVGVPAGAAAGAQLALVARARRAGLLLCVWLGFCAALLPLVVVFLPVSAGARGGARGADGAAALPARGSGSWRALQLVWGVAGAIVCGAVSLPFGLAAFVLYALRTACVGRCTKWRIAVRPRTVISM